MSENERTIRADELFVEVASVEEALSKAAAEWNLLQEELDAEVLGEERSFFGLFGKKLRVRISPKKRPLLLRGRRFVAELLRLMDLDAEAGFSEEDENMIDITGTDSEILVGRFGDGLKSMEYLLNLALRKPGTEPRVRLDSNGYRERRTRSLERLAEATARRVAEQSAPVRLEPMLSWERWVIHMTLKDREDVQTQSVGESPDRKVVVMPKFSEDRLQQSRPSRPRQPRRRRR
ncbi:MAG: single-stranded DNA-binding protein [Fretibacterium sp.]|nr:single-stranded DNA-binding protein [Fretibacterium sp.]